MPRIGFVSHLFPRSNEGDLHDVTTAYLYGLHCVPGWLCSRFPWLDYQSARTDGVRFSPSTYGQDFASEQVSTVVRKTPQFVLHGGGADFRGDGKHVCSRYLPLDHSIDPVENNKRKIKSSRLQSELFLFAENVNVD